MLGKLLRIGAVAAALVGFGVSVAEACNGYGQQLVGFAPQVNTGCYTQNVEYFTYPAQPPTASFWAPEFYMPPQPQRAYVQQQEFLGYAPQPVAQIGLAYATAQPVVNVRHVKTAAVVGFANPAYATGQAVALRGRFAGNPAVGNVNIKGVQQLNTGQLVGFDRQRVARETFFRRKVGVPLGGGNAVVGAVAVGRGY